MGVDEVQAPRNISLGGECMTRNENEVASVRAAEDDVKQSGKVEIVRSRKAVPIEFYERESITNIKCWKRQSKILKLTEK